MTTPTRPSADSTRAAILSAARTCFVEKGFAGTSISAIAKEAQINQSLIYHHFGNKQELWVDVKITILEEYHNSQNMNWDKLLTLKNCNEFISEFIQYRFGFFDQHPDALRIIEWQYLEPDPFQLTAYTPETIQTIIKRIKYFQKQKQLSSKYNPELIFSLLLTIPLGFFRSFRDLTTNLSKQQLTKMKNEYVQLCIETVLNSLKG